MIAKSGFAGSGGAIPVSAVARIDNFASAPSDAPAMLNSASIAIIGAAGMAMSIIIPPPIPPRIIIRDFGI